MFSNVRFFSVVSDPDFFFTGVSDPFPVFSWVPEPDPAFRTVGMDPGFFSGAPKPGPVNLRPDPQARSMVPKSILKFCTFSK